MVYAKMLGEKIEHNGTRVYLINTGWSGGSYGTGSRIKLKYTRKMVEAAQSGIIDDSEYVHDERFNLDVPTSCPGVPSELLNARNTWEDRAAYDEMAETAVDDPRGPCCRPAPAGEVEVLAAEAAV